VKGFGRGFQEGFDVGGGEGEGTFGEFGYVEGFEGVIVLGRVALGEDKGFMSHAEAVYVAEIRFTVQAVVALACEYEPAAV
jgi:hypothetical protein